MPRAWASGSTETDADTWLVKAFGSGQASSLEKGQSHALRGRGEKTACSSARGLARVAGLEFPDNSPDAISFSPFNDLQGSRTFKCGVRPLQPFADSLCLHHVG